MKHVIIHHNDFDGVISAAILLNGVLASGDSYSLVPVMYIGNDSIHDNMLSNLARSKMSDTDENTVYIVDFLYNKICDVWIDHHRNNDGPDVPESAKEFFNPRSKSAASVVMEYIMKNVEKTHASLNMVEAVKWADIIDSASYKSLDEYIEASSPWLQLRLLIEDYKKDHISARIVELLCNYGFDAGLVVEIIGGINPIMQAFRKKVDSVKGALVVSDGGIGHIITPHQNDFPRYSEFYVRPDIKYSIRSFEVDKKGTRKVSVGFNNWGGFENKINIGKTLKDIFPTGAGGHFDVGAAFCDESEVHENINKIVSVLKGGPDEG